MASRKSSYCQKPKVITTMFVNNKNICWLYIVLIIFCVSDFVNAKEKADVIVAKDGSGNYTTIQAAINSAPTVLDKPFIILVKNGIYNEKIFIEKNFITLVGEDRDSTRIIFAELRRNWLVDHPGNDWGSAVINVGNTVTDLTIANLTIYNNYGSTHAGEEKPNDHQFAIRGGGERVIIINCNIKADGGDTLSLWNSASGKYYHAYCYFEGWVDYVCPRGWCYITDSKFYGHNLSASIWHDGSNDPDQKFVIRNSYFDGVKNFPLGRNHRDGQFYLLDCKFSENMADQPIYQPSTAPAPFKWGERYYYFNCHREGGDYKWFKDNLNDAPNYPDQKEISAEWTFAGKWNPEANMPSILPFAFFPTPKNYAKKVSTKNLKLTWIPGRNAISHIVYFDTAPSVLAKKNVTVNKIKYNMLRKNTTYYWQVDEVTEIDTIKGQVWKFTTNNY